MKRYLTREEAIQEAGLERVLQAERADAIESHWDEATNLFAFYGVSDNYFRHGSVGPRVAAYYEFDYDVVMATEDSSNLDWVISYYEVN